MALAVAMVACQAAVKSPASVKKDIADLTFGVGAGAQTVEKLSSFFNVTNATFTAASDNEKVATAKIAGEVLTVTPVGPGSANVTVTAKGDEGEASQSIKVTVAAPEPPPANNAPTVRTIPNEALMVGETESVTLSKYADDPEGNALTYSASSSNDAVATASVAGAELTITAVAVGTATITVTVSDGTNSVDRDFDVEVTATPPVDPPVDPGPPNERPEQTLIDDIDDMRREGTRELDLSDYYDDPDGDALTYTATSRAEMVATVSVSGSMLTITGVGVGMAKITVTATDGTDEARQTFTVTVGSQAPVVDASLPTSFPLGLADATKVLNLAKYYDDPESNALTFTADSSDDNVATVTDPDAMSMITITAVGPGSATITVTAADSDNDPVSLEFFVTVSKPDVDNERPVVLASMVEDKDLHVGDTADLTLSMYFMDPDPGDTLGYTAVSDAPAVATVTDPDADSMITITAVSVGGATITITATDSQGESATATFEVSVTEVPNTPPKRSGIDAPEVTLVLEDDPTWTRDVSGYFEDADGDTLTYTAESSAPNNATESVSGSTVTITAVSDGTATITVTASDGNGGSVDLEIAVTVNPPPNKPPRLTPGRSAPDVDLVLVDDPSWARDMSGYFEDADGDELAYDAKSSDPTIATASESGSTVTITAVAVGSATITVTADDGEDSVALIIYVTVKPAPVTPTANKPPELTEMLPNLRIQIVDATPLADDTDDDTDDTDDDRGADAVDNKEIDLSEYFEDPDGALLFYKVTKTEDPDDDDNTPVIDLHSVAATAPGATTPAAASGDAPDGTDDDDTVVIIEPRNPGTATVMVTVTDIHGATTTEDFVVEVFPSDANTGPSLAGTLATLTVGLVDAAGTEDNVRMLTIDEERTVIDDEDFDQHFTDLNFNSGDVLTISVKYFANGVDAEAAANPDTDELDADEVGVKAYPSDWTWGGDPNEDFTLTLTGLRGTDNTSGTATERGHVVALVATDTFGESVARVFRVMVNNPPKAEGAQASANPPTDPLTLGDEDDYEDLTWDGLADAGNNERTVTLVASNSGYFHDPDAEDTLTCRYITSPKSDEDAPADIALDTYALTIQPDASEGDMTVTVTCEDTFDQEASDTLRIGVDGKTFSRS